jgi:hypothetical protein
MLRDEEPSRPAPPPAPSSAVVAPPHAHATRTPTAVNAASVEDAGNTSGQGKGAVIPPGIRGWNWGAFLLNWIWGMGNGVWIALLTFILGPVMSIILGIKGNEWAWRNKKWDSVEKFRKTQRAWSGAGIGLTCLSILLVIVIISNLPDYHQTVNQTSEPGQIVSSESTMNGDQKIATATIGEQGAILQAKGLNVEFSGKALPPGVTVNAYGVKDAEKNYPGGWLKLAGPVFDIDTGGQVLGEPVRVTLSYDPAMLGSADAKSLFGVTWNGINWDQRPSTVDTANRTVSFFTDHFSEVGIGFDSMTIEEYQARTKAQPQLEKELSQLKSKSQWGWGTHPTPHFTISYDNSGANAPLSGSDYMQHSDIDTTSDAPPYVQDLGVFLEDAYKRLGKDGLGFKSPPADRIIRVDIRALNPGVNGETLFAPVLYDIYIANQLRIPPDPQDPTQIQPLLPPDTMWKRLKITAGHEVFHVFQSYDAPFLTRWFCEASAAYMEWRLYHLEFPNDFADEYMTGTVGRPQFLYFGMGSGDKYDWYSWGMFLIYLQQLYQKQNGADDSANLDILHDAIFRNYPLAGEITPALLGAAQSACKFSGTWPELLADFSRAYYVHDYEKWPGLRNLITSSTGDTNEIARPINFFIPEFDLNARDFLSPHTFPIIVFPVSSSFLWHISGQPNNLPFATLVLRNDIQNPKSAGTRAVASLPKYWVYKLDLKQKNITGFAGPFDFSGADPTVSLDYFGSGSGAQVGGILVLTVDGRDRNELSQVSQLKAYLLPPPTDLVADPVQVTEGGKQVAKLRISWKVNDRWVNRAISEQFGGLTFEIRGPTGKLLASSIPIDQNSVDITPEPNMTHISVFLIDRYKNEGPPGTVEIEAPIISLKLDTDMPDPGVPDQPYKFTATPSSTPPAGCYYKWYDCGTLQNGTGSSNSIYFSLKTSRSAPRIMDTHKVSVELIYDGQAIASAAKDVNITTVGSLTIGSVPAGADIYVDGQRLGYQTPHKLAEIEAGIYHLVLKKAGYLDQPVKVTIGAGQLTEANPTLVKIEKPPDPPKEPTKPTPPTPPADDPSLCNCIGPWQQTILVQRLIATSDEVGEKNTEWRVDIIKPWTYDPVKKGCVGSFVQIRHLYNSTTKQWYDNMQGGGTDAFVSLGEARELCNALQK